MLKFILILLLLASLHRPDTYAQCNQSRLNTTSYFNGQCYPFNFQGSAGTLTPVYGSCGNLSFDSPLTPPKINTSLQDKFSVLQVKIFPNPCSDKINLSVTPDQNYKIKLLNMLGVELAAWNQTHIVDVSKLAPGCFLLQIINKNNKILHSEIIVKL
ncbi:MAG: T9SS type A sorting domain-containing protein [Saprospiraceae bacterium]|nr:T9SS type A sorting domain-containing protein [Saprospiraceae bacterium]